jgi:hypothetical protein
MRAHCTSLDAFSANSMWCGTMAHKSAWWMGFLALRRTRFRPLAAQLSNTPPCRYITTLDAGADSFNNDSVGFDT